MAGFGGFRGYGLVCGPHVIMISMDELDDLKGHKVKWHPIFAAGHKKLTAAQRKKAMLHGRVRPIGRHNSVCEHCNQATEYAENIDNKTFVCIRCGKPPSRFCVDVHFGSEEKTDDAGNKKRKARRYRIYSDKAGAALDTYERAFKLLARISEEINDRTFNASKYVASEFSEYMFPYLYDKYTTEKEQGGMITVYKLKQFKQDYYLPYFENTDVREIRTRNIHDFQLQLPGLSQKTKSHIMAVLKTFMRWLLMREDIERLPVFNKISLDRKIPVWVSLEKQDKMIEAIPIDDRDIFLFLGMHGTRPAEARALQVQDINFSENYIYVRRTFSGSSRNVLRDTTKTGIERQIPIHPAFFDRLRELCKGKLPGAFVFVQKNGRCYSNTTYQKLWQEAQRKTGIKANSYQALRHSFATLRVGQAGIHAVSKILGHTDIRTTMKYAHAVKNDMEAAMTAVTPSLPKNKQTVYKPSTSKVLPLKNKRNNS
ncbi:MAG: site-specific integrase [Dissulfurispiraceae bacterium]|jgi:integrase